MCRRWVLKVLFGLALTFVLGRDAEKKVAKMAGLIMNETDDLPGTVKHL